MNIGPASLQTIVELAMPAAFVVSLLLLLLYMRAVKRSMHRRTSPRVSQQEAALTDTPQSKPPPPPAPLQIAFADATSLRQAHQGARRTAAVQILAGSAYAVTLAMFWWSMTGFPYKWDAIIVIALMFAWPLVIVVGLVASVSWRGLAYVALTYAAIMATAVAIMTARTELSAQLFATVWYRANGLSTLIVLAFLARPIRAMGPLVSDLMIAALAGVFAINNLMDSPETIEHVASVATSIGLRGYTGAAIVAIVVWGTPALAAAFMCYLALRGLGRLYRARWISDQSLQVDAVWLVFSLSQGISQNPSAGFAAFLAYKLVSWAGNRWLRPAAHTDVSAPRLLLLRVFSLGSRSGVLFDAFSRLWRHIGSVRMIAGPDLANATVEPHEFLDFLAGRLQRSFIASPDMLDRRLTELRTARDPDGRFRVASFYCHADTWQTVLRRLARQSDLVLMDLRGFSPTNEGCVFELNELLESVPLSHILLVVDATTDDAFLRRTLHLAWTGISAASPNRSTAAPLLRLFQLDALRHGVDALVATLIAAHPHQRRIRPASAM